MNREWVTLAFGVVLVAAVAIVSVWQNYPKAPRATPPAETTTGPPRAPDADTPGEPAPSAPSESASALSPPPVTAAPAPRLDARVTVVHKHRFGDCEGTLRAVPGTLTYATENKEDAFRLAFAEIESFDMDAPRKNLRIRRRGGRTWNFTTKEESAAALVAFHREASNRLRR